jgi:DNA gyrase subunit A
VPDEWTPQDRLRFARDREHVVSAVVRGISEWRRVLERVESSATPDEARQALMRAFGFTQVQAMAVMDMQFRRISRLDRERLEAELEEVRQEIEELESDS